MTQQSDLLHVFTGISSAEVVKALNTVLNKRGDLEAGLAEWLTGRPLESLGGFLLSASAAFYLVERMMKPNSLRRLSTAAAAVRWLNRASNQGFTSSRRKDVENDRK
ncbi:MAG: hypothetical protein HC875_39685 [Anaerolineales bacterium]|nr:hypothetical protein [Anaerolineales bacterium]